MVSRNVAQTDPFMHMAKFLLEIKFQINVGKFSENVSPILEENVTQFIVAIRKLIFNH